MRPKRLAVPSLLHLSSQSPCHTISIFPPRPSSWHRRWLDSNPRPDSPSHAQPTSPFRGPGRAWTTHHRGPQSAARSSLQGGVHLGTVAASPLQTTVVAPTHLTILRSAHNPAAHYSFHPSPHTTQAALFPPRGRFLVLSRTHHPALRVSRPVLNPRILLADSVSRPLTEIPSSAHRASPFWPPPPGLALPHPCLAWSQSWVVARSVDCFTAAVL